MTVSLGNRVYKNIVRPSEKLLEKLKDVPSSNIGDFCGRLYCTNGQIKNMTRHNLVGPAFTVKVPMGDNLMIHIAMDLAQPGDILVIDGGGCEDRSLLGEMMMRYCEKKKLGGIVVDGAIRDLDYCREISIPLYARAVTPQGPYKNGPGEINVPVCCAGQVVFPGDILVGDCDGLVVVHAEQAEALSELGVGKKRGEVTEREHIENGEYLASHLKTFGAIAEKIGTVFMDETYSFSEWQ